MKVWYLSALNDSVIRKPVKINSKLMDDFLICVYIRVSVCVLLLG